MITAVTAKKIQTEYLESQCDIDLYMKDIEKDIKDCAAKGNGSIVFNFNLYNLPTAVMQYAKMVVKEKLAAFGYQVLNGDFPFEIFIYW